MFIKTYVSKFNNTFIKNHQDSENLGIWPDPACAEADSWEHRE